MSLVAKKSGFSRKKSVSVDLGQKFVSVDLGVIWGSFGVIGDRWGSFGVIWGFLMSFFNLKMNFIFDLTGGPPGFGPGTSGRESRATCY